jgi:hypothetical protein
MHPPNRVIFDQVPNSFAVRSDRRAAVDHPLRMTTRRRGAETMR